MASPSILSLSRTSPDPELCRFPVPSWFSSATRVFISRIHCDLVDSRCFCRTSRSAVRRTLKSTSSSYCRRSRRISSKMSTDSAGLSALPAPAETLSLNLSATLAGSWSCCVSGANKKCMSSFCFFMSFRCGSCEKSCHFSIKDSLRSFAWASEPSAAFIASRLPKYSWSIGMLCTRKRSSSSALFCSTPTRLYACLSSSLFSFFKRLISMTSVASGPSGPWLGRTM
mmetsp:Transcript_14368/g.54196  ORF Transcript_14368/g.54196 Transcript_14368/m.54196 type:complete len:227 (+) Transcript_14368:1522-2202(+)